MSGYVPADRCDRCGAEAKYQAVLSSGGQLLFCGHHFTEHEKALVDGCVVTPLASRAPVLAT